MDINKQKIIIASDSFKGSASSYEVAQYIENGILKINPVCEVLKFPIADGGEGTVDSLVIGLNGEYEYVEVIGPYGNTVKAKFGLLNEGKTAIIEMAEASGLHLIENEVMDPFKTTSFGTGELIKKALDYGVEEIFIGIGGSATNDGGAGAVQALGVSLKDSYGEEIGFGAEELNRIFSIEMKHLDKRINDVSINILSDVTNPLCGEKGASYIYGPQKGALEEDLPVLDEILENYGKKVEETLDTKLIHKNGAGAAGGMGLALIAFCSAKMMSGIDEILDLLAIEEKMGEASLVITGEGKMDGQSLQGKAPIGVTKLAKKHNLPVIAIVGSADYDLSKVYNEGIDLVLEIIYKPMLLKEALAQTSQLIERTAEKAYRVFRFNK
ncbi:glycerate kinase [Tetragenococcus halophilus subsp. halophilus]|uniref:Glycerate kinase n=2 Tax=Tetragenococcus halophilus TaxID=51669 RepID=A0A2H6CQT8_TETHA|nr:glycerate kinase [Tetragenococcus halophilus]MCO7027421.1 glycerate kinase [Tetragenococcus halophilus]MCO8284412.1 glycerate kinase [Tetragenococcus halophilus]MCO8287467.1 glycerate kinase [Tetragenococcus halophilus]MCO8289327.1 glycerate kinase [Tetragenococcus halophilus]MCO8296343.1 glycerate kinase [Tetragenococcus halophilus]